MSGSAQQAAEELIDVLQQENAALARFDLPAAAALVAVKQAAVAGLENAAHSLQDLSRELADKLRRISEENRVSLERAMAVQSRIIAIIVEACAPPDRRYGQTGRHNRPDGAGMAVSVRA